MRELAELGAEAFGLSTQTADYQREMQERLHLPFEVLSDAAFKFCEALHLPTFQVEGMRLIKPIFNSSQHGVGCKFLILLGRSGVVAKSVVPRQWPIPVDPRVKIGDPVRTMGWTDVLSQEDLRRAQLPADR
jgi:hypothetical protein